MWQPSPNQSGDPSSPPAQQLCATLELPLVWTISMYARLPKKMSIEPR